MNLNIYSFGSEMQAWILSANLFFIGSGGLVSGIVGPKADVVAISIHHRRPCRRCPSSSLGGQRAAEDPPRRATEWEIFRQE